LRVLIYSSNPSDRGAEMGLSRALAMHTAQSAPVPTHVHALRMPQRCCAGAAPLPGRRRGPHWIGATARARCSALANVWGSLRLEEVDEAEAPALQVPPRCWWQTEPPCSLHKRVLRLPSQRQPHPFAGAWRAHHVRGGAGDCREEVTPRQQALCSCRWRARRL